MDRLDIVYSNSERELSISEAEAKLTQEEREQALNRVYVSLGLGSFKFCSKQD